MHGFLADFILSVTPNLLYVALETPSPAHARLLKAAWDVIVNPAHDSDNADVEYAEASGGMLYISGQASLTACEDFRKYAPTVVEAQLAAVRRVCDVFIGQ